MIRYEHIQEKLANLVGWAQDYGQTLDEEIMQSDSGLYFQHAHPLLTVENVRNIMPENFTLRYPEWSSIVPYQKGSKVRHLNKVWKNSEYSYVYEPSKSDLWSEYDPINDYLAELTANGISTMVQNFIQYKQLTNETKNLLERHTFFEGAGRLQATITNRHKIVGFEIEPVRSMGVTMKVERIGLQFSENGNVHLYLFHSSQPEPIEEFTLEYTQNGGVQWYVMDNAYLPYAGGGVWFLCYDQDELPLGMEAINVSKDWSREPCGTCNIGSVQAWRELTKYLQISPFAVDAPTTFAEYPEMWDIAQTGYTNTTSYGLNCEVTVGCDLTDFIVEQKQLFANVLQKQVAAIALRTMAMNPEVRVNRNQSNASRMDILYELDGNSQGRPSGLGYELKEAYKALSIDTKNIDRICLSCNNHGVKYRTV